jgi:ubiquinone/menaquinone biosynthesis C-methylase UbiE
LEKFRLIDTIKELYKQGGNIIQYLKGIENRNINTIEDILISYDFQSGSYIRQYYVSPEYGKTYCQSLAKVINDLGEFESIMEAGVGEATTLGVMVASLKQMPQKILGFDLSWSRINFAKSFTMEKGLQNVTLFTSDLFEIPLADSSVDVVYTSHSIEPNGGKEREALTELYRVAKKYVVLLEPSYELGTEEARARMRAHGYVTSLYSTSLSLGYKIVEHRLFDISDNPLNPTGLLIIEKNVNSNAEANLVCPVSKSSLRNIDNHVLYSDESLLAYPVIKGIPCLLQQNGVLATHFNLDYEKFRAGLVSK